MKDAGLDPALAVAVVPNAATAHLAVTQTARMRDAERVLVHGALGGLAVGFPGIARQLGASRVVGTVRASDLGAEGKQNSRTTRSSIPLSCPHAWRASASISSSTPLAVPSAPPASGCSRRWDACSRSATPAETGTRSTATGSGSGTWPFTAFRWGSSSRATRTPRATRATAAIRAAAAGLAQANVETLPLSNAAVAHARLENHSVNGRLVLRP
jgi:NADPH:quinone reductase